MGSEGALAELAVAVDHDHLFIQHPITPRPKNLIKIACQHLQQNGLFPQTELMSSLQAFSSFETAASGDGNHVLGRASVVIGKPPFKTLDVKCILDGLRGLARRYEDWTNSRLELPVEYSYSLGIVTMLLDTNGNPKFAAQLFSSEVDKFATGTLWLSRSCIRDRSGGYTEEWRAFGDGTFDMSTLEQPVTGFVSQAQPAALGDHDMFDHACIGQTPEPDSDTDLPVTTSHLHQATISVPEEDERLFEVDPNSIRGPVLLRLACFYGNTELFERINAGLAAKGLSLLADSNVITRRITVAIDSTVLASVDLTYGLVRTELNEARKVNGVVARMRARAREERARARGDRARARSEREATGNS